MVWESDPLLLSLGSFQLKVLSVYLALGYLFAFAEFRRVSVGAGRSADDSIELLSLVLIGTLVGGRLVSLMQFDRSTLMAPSLRSVFVGEFNAEGAALGALGAVFVHARDKKLDVRAVLDWSAAGGLGAAAIASLGSFFSTRSVGTATGLPWGMRFPGHDGALDAPFRHPVALYECLGMLAIGAGVLWLSRTGGRVGRAAGVALALFGGLRLALWSLRVDASSGALGVKGVALGLVVLGGWLVLMSGRRGAASASDSSSSPQATSVS